MIRLNLSGVMFKEGMNIQQLHERSGVSRNTIRLMMNNEPKGIQFESLNRLIEVLNCSVEDIIKYVPGTTTVFFSNEADAVFFNFKTDSIDVSKKIVFEIFSKKEEADYIHIYSLSKGDYLLEGLIKEHLNFLEIFIYMFVNQLIKAGILKTDRASVFVIHSDVTSTFKEVSSHSTVVSINDEGADLEAIEHYKRMIQLRDDDEDMDKEIMIKDNEMQIKFSY